MDEATDPLNMLVTHQEARLRDIRHVLWHFGDPLGLQPGSFTGHLLRAMDTADMENFARLSFGFRDLAGVFTQGREDIESLRDVAKASLR